MQYYVIQTLCTLPESIRDILDVYRDKLDLPQTCVESFRDYSSQHSFSMGHVLETAGWSFILMGLVIRIAVLNWRNVEMAYARTSTLYSFGLVLLLI